MGDAADDAFDAALRDEEDRAALESVCEQPGERKCKFEINDDGLYECRVCGKVTDL